jgi:DNA-binding SARP family transcriptional activator
MSSPTAGDKTRAKVSLSLIRDFELRQDDAIVDIPPGSQRLVAFLALHAGPIRRSFVAGTLWPASTEARATANLRSALWRIAASVRGHIVDASSTHLWLQPGVEVDLTRIMNDAHDVLDRGVRGPSLVGATRELAAFGDDVLAGWYDEWVVMEQERFRTLRLHALDQLGEQLLAEHRHADALQAGLAAVRADPLRESAHRLLVRTHRAQGNVAAAIRQYLFYARLLAGELGARPSPAMEELVGEYTGRPGFTAERRLSAARAALA